MIYVLLPAYNEEDALRPLAAKVDHVMRETSQLYQIVVVDDGSSDGTADILEELKRTYPIHVITHQYNRGLGETARDGFEYVAEVAEPEDVVVRMDCDDTHDPEYIPTMLAKLDEGYEVVTASRYAPGGGQVGLDRYRRAISRIANLLFKTVFPIPGLWEYTCGFRAYRAAVVQDALRIFGNKFIDLKGLGFTGTLEKLIKFRMMGARIAEIPFVLRYDQKLSSSKVVTSITTLGCFVLMIKHHRFWAAEGQRWKREIEARKARVYGPGSEPPDIDAIRRFWDSQPLFVGESRTRPGEKAFFQEHEEVTLREHSGALDPIYTKGIQPGSSVLDVGCGIGFWVHQFSRRGAQVSACDLSPRAVELTRRRLELFGINADVREGNAEDLPYESGSFDHINCQGVIHHTPETGRCLEEFARVLKPSGTLCFSVYYRPLAMRVRPLFWLVTRSARACVRLRGRGREGLLHADSPEELVRLYDGMNNPLGKMFSRQEIEGMLAGRFSVLEVERMGIPRRALPVAMPDAVHRWLSRRLGLMIVYRCSREPAEPWRRLGPPREAAEQSRLAAV